MLSNLETLLTVENIYIAANWGVLPFWLLLILSPVGSITKIFVHSVIIPLLLASAYSFLALKIYSDGDIFEVFNLYLSLDGLYTVFSNENFLLIFWIHFLAISLFIGSWIARDANRHMVPRIFSSISIIITYFSGPIGLIFYWIFRIFYSKKINFDE